MFVFILYSKSGVYVTPLVNQALNSHMWLMATVLEQHCSRVFSKQNDTWISMLDY